MNPVFRNYTSIAGITDDYFKVREFLLRLGYSEFVYARWDWMITHSLLDKTAVGKIGLWEENDDIVGLATFDTRPGIGYCLTHPEYRDFKEEMLRYAEINLSTPKGFEIVIPDTDHLFQDIAARSGYVASDILKPISRPTPGLQLILSKNWSDTSKDKESRLRPFKPIMARSSQHNIAVMIALICLI